MPPRPGMSMFILRDGITEDAASAEFFGTFSNWYFSSYGCRSCPRNLYKIVFSEGHEFEIVTDDSVNPHIAVKRMFTCDHCKRLATSAASEADVAEATERAMRTGGGVAVGLLSDPNNFEYQCVSTAEYQQLLRDADAFGTMDGRHDSGYIRLGTGDTQDELEASPAAPGDVVRRVLLGSSVGAVVMALGIAAALSAGVLPLPPDFGTVTPQQSPTSSSAQRTPPKLATPTFDPPKRTWEDPYAVSPEDDFAEFLEQHEGEIVRIRFSLGAEWENVENSAVGEFWPYVGSRLNVLRVLPSAAGRSGFDTDPRDLADCDRWCGVYALAGITKIGSVRLAGYYYVKSAYKARVRQPWGDRRKGDLYIIQAAQTQARP